MYLYATEFKAVELECNENEIENELICTLEKEDLLLILSRKGEIFGLGESINSENEGIYIMPSVLGIIINYSI